MQTLCFPTRLPEEQTAGSLLRLLENINGLSVVPLDFAPVVTQVWWKEEKRDQPKVRLN